MRSARAQAGPIYHRFARLQTPSAPSSYVRVRVRHAGDFAVRGRRATVPQGRAESRSEHVVVQLRGAGAPLPAQREACTQAAGETQDRTWTTSAVLLQQQILSSHVLPFLNHRGLCGSLGCAIDDYRCCACDDNVIRAIYNGNFVLESRKHSHVFIFFDERRHRVSDRGAVHVSRGGGTGDDHVPRAVRASKYFIFESSRVRAVDIGVEVYSGRCSASSAASARSSATATRASTRVTSASSSAIASATAGSSGSAATCISSTACTCASATACSSTSCASTTRWRRRHRRKIATAEHERVALRRTWSSAGALRPRAPRINIRLLNTIYQRICSLIQIQHTVGHSRAVTR